MRILFRFSTAASDRSGEHKMKIVFWASLALVCYTYLGYPLWLWIRAKWFNRPVTLKSQFPSVSIALVVHDEASVLTHKLQNLLELQYPADKIEIIVVSDGSTDATNRIVSAFDDGMRVRTIMIHEPRGKAEGLNHAISAARGEIVVFTDARQIIAPDAVSRLMENFGDPTVGCASGELVLGDPSSGDTLRGVGLYWKIEKLIRSLQSASGSVVGATGALYAVRRSLLRAIPPETIVDDVIIPMRVVRQGARVVFEPRARAWDIPDLGTEREFRRKVRTLGGMYQILKLEPWLLSPANPALFDFVSHKILRLAAPFALCAAFLSSLLIPAPIFRLAFFLQVLFYALSACAPFRSGRNPVARLADVSFTFVLLNLAALVAFGNFVAGRKPAWGS